MNYVILRIRVRAKDTGRITTVEKHYHAVQLEDFRQLCEDYGDGMKWSAYWGVWQFNMG